MSLVHGPIFQVAWVVDDIATAEAWFTDTLGVPAWTRFDNVAFGPETCTYRGEPADYTIHVALGYAGTQQIELIQPVSGVNLYTEHLERCGPGLHHIAWIPDDFDATVTAAQTQGIAITQRGSFGDGGLEFAYLDGSAGGAPHIELLKVSPAMLAFFESLIPSGRGPGR